MFVVTKKVPFKTTLITVVFMALLKIYSVSINDSSNKTQFNFNSVQRNTQTIEPDHNWNILLIKESILTKQKIPKINNS